MSLATTVTLTAKNVADHLEDFLKRFRYLGYLEILFLKAIKSARKESSTSDSLGLVDFAIGLVNSDQFCY